VEVDSATAVVEVVADDEIVVCATVVVGDVEDGSVVEVEVSNVVVKSGSTVGSAESSWNATMTARLATMTATSAPMKPLFLGTYPANRSDTSKSFPPAIVTTSTSQVGAAWRITL